MSLELASFTPHSANPKYGQVFENFDHKRRYHVQAAHAIMLAFAAIEELQLEVRSSSKRKRFLDNEKGIWNPIVLEDVNQRLEKIGIREDDNIDWVYRGDSTEVHKSMAPQFGYDSDFQEWHEDVKDKTLTFAEALHNASYLRNFFAAHKFQELSQYLSPYDVYNVQDLARTLILHKVELWEDHRIVDLYH
ncbi:MAG: hypothetical protein HN431_03060 [Bacteroidetes bacterium]|nr:hypothetical protein [Bacteroidota bacterium]